MSDRTAEVENEALSASTENEKFDILVAEDDAMARDLVESIFEVEGWDCPTLVPDGQDALDLLEERRWDILVTDLNMPRVGGEELVRRASEMQPDLTIVVITANGTVDRAVSLMRQGAHDFIAKPYSVETFLESLRAAKERVLRLHEVRGLREVVDALLAALEGKDRYLEGHASRVSKYAYRLGKVLGLPRNQLRMLELAALLHDVGKIGVHEDILNKTGKLTDEEYEEMKRHPVLSHDILAPVGFLQSCLPAVLHHHERMDGKGYPQGLVGEDIPYGARIISVVDAFDAMTSRRSYRDAMEVDRVIEILREVAGTQLDPDVVDAFLGNFDEIVGQELERQS